MCVGGGGGKDAQGVRWHVLGCPPTRRSVPHLDDGGEGAALMSTEGFKAYADDSMWVSAGSAGARGVMRGCAQGAQA